ncbi:MAG: peptidylprolyl isomerase [Candidatus Pacearchaeota archaeon]
MDIQRLKRKYSDSYLQEIFDERATKILILETYRGSIFIELFHKDVPLVKEIIAKALLGEFDGMIFYNCNPFFVQLRKKVEEKETADKIIRPYLKNLKGTVGLINSKKNPSKALLDHFYICLTEIPEIDGEYTIIGRVVKGLDVLNKIWDGNTVRKCYIEKGYITKPPAIRKLHVLYWVGVALMIFFAFWLLSSHLAILKDFQKEIFKQVITDRISKAEAIYFLMIGLVLIVFSLAVSSLQEKVKIGKPPEAMKKTEEEKEIMKKIEEKRIGLMKELEKYKEKELKEKEKEGEKAKEIEKLKKELEELKKKAEEEKARLEEKLKKELEEKLKEREKPEEEIGKRIEEEKKKKELEKRKEEEKKKIEEEKRKEFERLQLEAKKKEEAEKKLMALDKERKKMIEIMKKPTDLKKEIKKKPKEEIKKEVLPKIAQRTETQLDVLYDLLEKHKSLKLSYITETFGISKEEAIEWCNILVEHGLAELKYPAFGEPILIKK